MVPEPVIAFPLVPVPVKYKSPLLVTAEPRLLALDVNDAPVLFVIVPPLISAFDSNIPEFSTLPLIPPLFV